MGNKQGYGETILAVLGLRSGQGAGAYLWAEADPDVAALLRCYPDASMLRRVAEIIRGWADEEPRALWERLRGERKARGTAPPERGPLPPAGWIVSMGWGNGDTPGAGMGWNGGYSGPGNARGNTRYPDIDSLRDRCHRLAEYATIVSGNRLVNMSGPDLMNTGNGGTRHGGEFATPVGDVAAAFERAAGEVASTSIMAGWSVKENYFRGPHGMSSGEHSRSALTIDGAAGRFEGMAREVAGHVFVAGRSIMGKGGFVETEDTGGRARGLRPENFSDRVGLVSDSGGWPSVAVLSRIPEAADVAVWLGTPGDLDDCVVYMDPPYVGTTGYAATLGRDEVVRHARAYAELGAVVAISEAEVVIPEWDAVEITAGRKGQKRTFSKQQAEWLTMNRAPSHRVAVQAGLFAVGA
jgi:hypothetical protein